MATCAPSSINRSTSARPNPCLLYTSIIKTGDCHIATGKDRGIAGAASLINDNAIEHVVDGENVELTLQSGETLRADVVIYGIGISANDQLAREANLDTCLLYTSPGKRAKTVDPNPGWRTH